MDNVLFFFIQNSATGREFIQTVVKRKKTEKTAERSYISPLFGVLGD